MLTLEKVLSREAALLDDEELQQKLALAERALVLSARTRKTIAERELYCLQCELRTRAQRGAAHRSETGDQVGHA
ncbi:MAG TPA: hypothetical protein VFB34_03780 [Chloroflexota bacterium]|nr:hypothetical protein [Chloroflexota bacterium]